MKVLEINRFFGKFGQVQTRYRGRFLFGIILFTLLAGLGIFRFEFSYTNDGWFLEGDAAKVNAEKFRENFGNDASVAVLVTVDAGKEGDLGLGVRDSAVVMMMDSLRRYMMANIPLAKEIRTIENTTHTEALIHLSLERYNEPAEDALKIGRAVANMMDRPEFKPQRQSLTKWNLYAAGEPYLEVAKNDSTMPQAAKSVVIGVLIMIFCLFVFTRSKFGVMVPFMATALAMVSVFGICGWLGVKPDFTLFTLPMMLGMALSVGYSVHFINGFKQAFRRLKNRKAAIVEAITETGWPIFFTVATTVATMLSFLFVEMPVMFVVGSICGAMVFAVYLYVIIFVPIFLSFGDGGFGADRDEKQKLRVARETREALVDEFFGKFGGKIFNYRIPIILVTVVAVVVSAIGCTKLKVNMDYVEMFGTKLPFVERLVKLMDSELANIYSYNVMVDVGEVADSLTFKNPANVVLLDSAVNDLGKLALTKVTDGVPRVMIGGVTENLKVAYLHVELKEWNSKQVDIDIDSAQTLVKKRFPGAEIGVEGYGLEQASMNNKLVKGEINSIFISIGVIAALLILAFMSVRTGLIGLLPNVATIGVIGGVMGFMGYSMDMMTMMVMPMALGIAVDDTIHFVNHAKLHFERTGSYRLAVQGSFRDVGKSMFSTTAILCMMFVAYMVSPVTIFFRVGFMASVGLATALVADCTITPVLIVLAKPFGKNLCLKKNF
ncbi:MAG: MMPL family transporter [Fibrobacteraceae bacterium]|nr:MMPL family transporter [Fibrobacteraceae bacterium]